MTWARGCGTSGWVSPFGGAAKLPWNLEWAAQWSLFGVTIEPNGKDLSTAGGSRDRSDAIAREVFEREPPMNVPYEFLNIGGKKMSTSKGRGAAAHTIAEVVPPEQLRFLFLRPRPNQVIEFDPDGTDAVPRLFDEFDRFARGHRGPRGEGRDPARLRGDVPLRAPRPEGGRRGRGVRPSARRSPTSPCSPRSRASTSPRGSRRRRGRPLTEREQADPRRARRGRASLARGVRAGGRSRRRPARRAPCRDGRPRRRRSAGSWTRCRARAEREAPAGGDAWQALIFDLAKDGDLPARRAFEAIYAAFLGRPNGPRAGWLLASLEPVVRRRARPRAAGATPGGAAA